MKHAELIARLEAAEVGSRELDAEICIALGYVGNNQGYRPLNVRISDGGDEWLDYELGTVEYTAIIPDVSQSLDAALAPAERVLPVFKHWALGTNGGEEFVATVAASSTAPHGWDGVAKTPATALCIAILKALEAQ